MRDRRKTRLALFPPACRHHLCLATWLGFHCGLHCYREDDASQKKAHSAYIEFRRETGPNYGCSFIEFDGKGGFLDFGQFKHALSRLDELKARSDVLLVLYCHGWNNNPQSADVIRFVGFLKRLADSEPIRTRHLRVEGGTTKKSMRQTIGLLQFHETLSGIIMIFGRNLVWRCSPAYIGLSSNWGENQPLPRESIFNF